MSNYEGGKENESPTWTYLEQHGFIRPTKEQRKQIVTLFEKDNKVISSRAFDVIKKEELEILPIKPKVLYEVKTCGKQKSKKISTGFKGMGFTLTENEKNNADKLGDAYKFIFVDLVTNKHHIFELKEFFNKEYARIYRTWSIFINVDLV